MLNHGGSAARIVVRAVGQWGSGTVGQWDSGAVGQWSSGTVEQ
ncbi:MAG TPA: hypothetical protein P5121_15320 [Caldilineaceae bacterium]|nr:hypothetical protein [Caldilineaceae bacterium]